MRTFGKLIAAAAVIAASASSAFAAGYSGDLQLQLGWQGASTTVKTSKITGNMGPAKMDVLQMAGVTGSIETEFPTNSFYLALANYNLFSLKGLFSVGFFEKLDMAVGAGSEMNVSGGNAMTSAAMGGISKHTRRFGLNFIIGPAAGVAVSDIAKLQCGVGFVGGVEIARRSRDDISDGNGTGVVGVAVDIQAKFLPLGTVSPLIGFQYAYRGAGSFDYNYGDTRINMPPSPLPVAVNDLTAEGSFRAHSYTVYAGVSWNFAGR